MRLAQGHADLPAILWVLGPFAGERHAFAAGQLRHDTDGRHATPVVEAYLQNGKAVLLVAKGDVQNQGFNFIRCARFHTRSIHHGGGSEKGAG